MATQASLSLVLEYDVTVVTDATATIRHVGEWRPLAGTAATDHLYTVTVLIISDTVGLLGGKR